MLEEFLLSIGYDDLQIDMLFKIYPKSKYSEATLLYNFKNLYHYFRRNGFDNGDFINLTITRPDIILESIENIRVKVDELNSIGFHKLDAFYMIKKYPYILSLSIQKIKSKLEVLQDLAFPKDNIISIFANYPTLLRMEESTFSKHYQIFIGLGYSTNELLSILTVCPALFDYSNSMIQKKFDEYKQMGFTSSDIIKVTSILPELLIQSSNLIHEKFNDLLEFGYSDMDIVQIIKKVPTLLKNYYLEQISTRLDCLLSIGFSHEDIIMITCNNPYIFFYKNEDITNKIEGMGSLGYTLEVVLDMIRKLPLLVGYSLDTILERMNYYKDIGLENMYLNNSIILKYSIDFIKARKNYLDKYNPNDSLDNLFIKDVDFKLRYHIDRISLLKGEF